MNGASKAVATADEPGARGGGQAPAGPFEPALGPELQRSAVVGTLDGRPLRAEFPLYVEMFGVPRVVIPATEYRLLTAKQDLRGRFHVPSARGRGRVRKQSTVDRDPEVSSFLRERIKAVDTVEAMRKACVSRYGAERAPSCTRIVRFRQHILAGG